MVQFCYLRLYFGIDNVCRRLLQWIARIKNGLKLRPTRYRTYSNQISTRPIRSDNESAEEGDFEVVMAGYAWPCRKDQYEIMTGTGASGSMRLVSYDLYFQLRINCTVIPLKYAGHHRDRTKCLVYRGVHIIEVGSVWFLAFLGPNELSVIERCPYHRGALKERLDCTSGSIHVNLYLDFSRAYPQKWLTCWRKKNSGYYAIIFPVGKRKLLANQN